MTDPVLVVGAGPIGLTMALELARYGVPVRLVDKMTVRSNESRACGVWPRTLELLDRACLSQDLVARGNKVDTAAIFAGNASIARIDIRDVASPFPFVLMIPQYDTEAVLEQHVGSLGVRSELGVEMAMFAQDESGVTATLRHSDGRNETQRFSHLIACDGSHSPVRHALNLNFEGETMATDWALGDFHMRGVPFGSNELATYWHVDGPIVFFPLGPNRYRLIASLGPSGASSLTTPSREAFQAIVDRRGPGGIQLEDTIWTSAFRINERQVSDYHVGRVFLAGDAAHVHSPAGAQGMNTGMQDAINLAWKLAMARREPAAAPLLLESYNAERRPVGAAVISSAGRLTKMATLANPVAQHVRNAIAHIVLGFPQVQHELEGTMTEISTSYPHSPLNGPDSSSDFKAGSRMRPIAGERPYGAGEQPRFTLRASSSPDVATLARFSTILEPDVRSAAEGAGITLVRPDGYLALAVGNGDFAEVETYLARFGVHP